MQTWTWLLSHRGRAGLGKRTRYRHRSFTQWYCDDLTNNSQNFILHHYPRTGGWHGSCCCYCGGGVRPASKWRDWECVTSWLSPYSCFQIVSQFHAYAWHEAHSWQLAGRMFGLYAFHVSCKNLCVLQKLSSIMFLFQAQTYNPKLTTLVAQVALCFRRLACFGTAFANSHNARTFHIQLFGGGPSMCKGVWQVELQFGFIALGSNRGVHQKLVGAWTVDPSTLG